MALWAAANESQPFYWKPGLTSKTASGREGSARRVHLIGQGELGDDGISGLLVGGEHYGDDDGGKADCDAGGPHNVS